MSMTTCDHAAALRREAIRLEALYFATGQVPVDGRPLRINGHPAVILVWTPQQWRQMDHRDRPLGALEYAGGLRVALVMLAGPEG